MNKYVSSIDGFFKKKIKLVNLELNKKIISKNNTILGKGNSISQLPYVENFNSIELNVNKEFFIDKKKQSSKEKLCNVRSIFDKFNLISGLHSFMSDEDEIYKNVLPPISLLDEIDKQQLINDPNKIDFNLRSLRAA